MKIHPNINKWHLVEQQFKQYKSNNIHFFIYSSQDEYHLRYCLNNIPRRSINIHMFYNIKHIYQNIIGRNMEVMILYNYSKDSLERLLTDNMKDYLRIYTKNRNIPKIILL